MRSHLRVCRLVFSAAKSNVAVITAVPTSTANAILSIKPGKFNSITTAYGERKRPSHVVVARSPDRATSPDRSLL